MIEMDGSRKYPCSSDRLWAVVSDTSRLAEWVPTMRVAHPIGGSQVHLEGDSHGHPYALDSQLHVDQDGHRLDWGATGDAGYRGWLRVSASADGSQAQIHISLPDDRIADSDGAAEIRRGLEEAFERVAGLVGS